MTAVAAPNPTGSREDRILSLATCVEINARKASRGKRNAAIDDFRQEGWLGAIQAVDRFDESEGIQLNTFADHRVRGQILDAGRRMDPLARSHRQAVKRGEESFRYVELTPRSACDNGESWRVENEIDVRALIESSGLTDRERESIERYFLGQERLKAIGSRFGVGEGRVSQILGSAIQKMRERCRR